MHLCIEVNPKLRPHQHLPPSTTSPKAAPLHTQCHPMGVISEQGTVDSISSKELDKRIMKCLQQSTSEWCEQISVCADICVCFISASLRTSKII